MSRHVLIIEDNLVNLKLVLKYLGAKGYRVVGAGSTEEADAAFLAERPGLVLVDVSLPGEDGLSWVRRIAAPAASRCPWWRSPPTHSRWIASAPWPPGARSSSPSRWQLKSLLRVTEKYLGPPALA